MEQLPFDLINYERSPLSTEAGQNLGRHLVARAGDSFAADARRFIPGNALETAINTALTVGAPLLITGEPGTGKTQAAYYAAYKLNLEPVLHFQVKSDSGGRDLLYHFDTVRYFHDAQVRREAGLPDKTGYLERRPLWQAMASEQPRVLLIDEIDKAPRDFPNDLLHELDKMEFFIPETQQTISAHPDQRPIVFITSNSERRLPEPFLRRCVYHHIRFNEELVRRAIDERRGQFEPLSDDFLKLALRRFIALREYNLRKKPATGEFLVWLRVLAAATERAPERLQDDLAKLPYLGVLLKDHRDLEEVQGR